MSASSAIAFAQSASPQQSHALTVEGTVLNSAGEPLSGISVLLEEDGHSRPVETRTNADGIFAISADHPGVYTLRAHKAGWQDAVAESLHVSVGSKKHIDLVFKLLGADHPASSGGSLASRSPSGAMDFDDKPNFTVAGVTDWTGAGGHGSDTSLRTSEALTKETLALKAGSEQNSATTPKNMPLKLETSSESKLRAAVVESPGNFEANHRLGTFYFHRERYRQAIPLLETAHSITPGNYANAYDLAQAYEGVGDFARARDHVRKMLASVDRAELHHLSGDIDERLDDPLEAVLEYEQAARLDPSEQNYFDWGAELLLHRASQPAAEVFTKGSRAHPSSARMLAGLGAALYANGSYDDAARQLCRASELDPADSRPYIFLGKMEESASAPLPCVDEKLARFARDQPMSAIANFYYAMALWKRERGSKTPAALQPAEGLLRKAVMIDPKFDEAYLQLGILYAASGDLVRAIPALEKAIEMNPQRGEAHYRLGLAYRRVGEEVKAEQEFRMHEQIEKTQTAAIERQRREVRQFLITLKDQPSAVH